MRYSHSTMQYNIFPLKRIDSFMSMNCGDTIWYHPSSEQSTNDKSSRKSCCRRYRLNYSPQNLSKNEAGGRVRTPYLNTGLIRINTGLIRFQYGWVFSKHLHPNFSMQLLKQFQKMLKYFPKICPIMVFSGFCPSSNLLGESFGEMWLPQFRNPKIFAAPKVFVEIC